MANKYSIEQLEFIKSEYLEDPSRATLEFLAQKFDSSVRSMASQLTRMGIYKKLSYTTKTGERPVSKSEMVEMIASALDVPSEVLDGLDIAPKTALRYILRGLDEESDEYFRPGYVR